MSELMPTQYKLAAVPPIKRCCGAKPKIGQIPNTSMYSMTCPKCGRRQDGGNLTNTVSLWNENVRPAPEKSSPDERQRKRQEPARKVIKSVRKAAKKTAKKAVKETAKKPTKKIQKTLNRKKGKKS